MNGRFETFARRICDEPSAGLRGGVLFLHGGPGERIGTTVVDMDAPFLGRRYEIVDPSYNGDSSAITGIVNYRYGYNLNKTLNDIRPSLYALQARYRNVTLLGGSFGGYLAAALSRELKPSDTLVLFRTIACTPYEHFITEHPEGSLVAERKVTKQESVLIKKMSDGMWESYFGPFFQKSTADLIDFRRPGQIVLIYSPGRPARTSHRHGADRAPHRTTRAPGRCNLGDGARQPLRAAWRSRNPEVRAIVVARPAAVHDPHRPPDHQSGPAVSQRLTARHTRAICGDALALASAECQPPFPSLRKHI